MMFLFPMWDMLISWRVVPGVGERVSYGLLSAETVEKHRMWSQALQVHLVSKKLITLRKFNIVPERWWLEDYFPLGIPYFQGLC